LGQQLHSRQCLGPPKYSLATICSWVSQLSVPDWAAVFAVKSLSDCHSGVAGLARGRKPLALVTKSGLPPLFVGQAFGKSSSRASAMAGAWRALQDARRKNSSLVMTKKHLAATPCSCANNLTGVCGPAILEIIEGAAGNKLMAWNLLARAMRILGSVRFHGEEATFSS
jgi:hypothetical protein